MQTGALDDLNSINAEASVLAMLRGIHLGGPMCNQGAVKVDTLPDCPVGLLCGLCDAWPLYSKSCTGYIVVVHVQVGGQHAQLFLMMDDMHCPKRQ